ncbi:MAG: hypothetical protein ACYC2H_01435 [Thermoplasmatota archaeon]
MPANDIPQLVAKLRLLKERAERRATEHEHAYDTDTRVTADDELRAAKHEQQLAEFYQEVIAAFHALQRQPVTHADRELLTLANGDRLHADASNNAQIVQSYIDNLKALKAASPVGGEAGTHWMQRFNDWCRSTDYMRTTTRPMDAGEQMAQRDAHDLLVEAAAALQSPPPRESAPQGLSTRERQVLGRLVSEMEALSEPMYGEMRNALKKLLAWSPAPPVAETPRVNDAISGARVLTNGGRSQADQATGNGPSSETPMVREFLHSLTVLDLPDSVIEPLERLAERAGCAYELEALRSGLPMDPAKRPTDDELLDDLNAALPSASPVAAPAPDIDVERCGYVHADGWTCGRAKGHPSVHVPPSRMANPPAPETPAPDVAPVAAELAWLIERDINSVLHYWTGRVIDGREIGAWSPNHLDARRFARREDAACMLTWHCGDLGRVAEHMWAPVAAPAPETPAPDAMPEIQVGDVVSWTQRVVVEDEIDNELWAASMNGRKDLDAIERNGVVIWRRPVEPPPAPEKET